MGQRVSQSDGDDGFGGANSWPYGAQPGTEGGPYEVWDGGGERQHDALGNQAELDESVVGVEFSSDVIAAIQKW